METEKSIVKHDQSLLNTIAEASVNPNMDSAKLLALVELQERVLNREAREAFAEAFVKMRPQLPTVIRTKHNSQTKSNYAPLEEINETIDPVLNRHGFGTSTKVISQDPSGVTVRAELWHEKGHVEHNQITIPIDDCGIAGTKNKTLPHAVASSVQYAKRIALCSLLNISTGDDRDGNLRIGDEEAAELKQLLKDTNSDVKKFLAFMKVSSVDEIPAKQYLKAKNAIRSKKKEGTNAGA